MPVTIGVVPQGVDATEVAVAVKRLLEDVTGKYESVDMIRSDRLPSGVDYVNPHTIYLFIFHAGEDVNPEEEQGIGRAITGSFHEWMVVVVWVRAGPFFANGKQI